MWIHSILWERDPLPVPPAPFGTMAFWRWWSALVLAERAKP